MTTSLKERFEEKFIPVPWSGCWLWTGMLAGIGYAAIREDAAKGSRQRRASHVSYEMYKGPIPKGILVLHKCDTPECVNPEHLFLGTHLDNAKDRNAKGRQAHNGGEKNGQAKLTWERAEKLRSDKRPYTVLSKEYGVSIGNISSIKNRKRWVR